MLISKPSLSSSCPPPPSSKPEPPQHQLTLPKNSGLAPCEQRAITPGSLDLIIPMCPIALKKCCLSCYLFDIYKGAYESEKMFSFGSKKGFGHLRHKILKGPQFCFVSSWWNVTFWNMEMFVMGKSCAYWNKQTNKRRWIFSIFY